MLIDLHTHTSRISVCARADYRDLVDEHLAAGYDGLVLTNHFNKQYVDGTVGGYSADFYPRAYIEEFERARAYAAKKAFKVLFGMEIALTLPDCPYAEFLLYGIEPRFLTVHARLYELDQRSLYLLCQENGILVVQAHPFRREQGHFPHDAAYLDGVEINCHPRFLRQESLVREFAARHGLIVTAGSDYHVAGQALGAGVELPRSIDSEKELAAALRRGGYKVVLP